MEKIIDLIEMNVEVFKTNVDDRQHAGKLLKKIHKQLPGCSANFDLEDCDKVLRVESSIDEQDFDGVIEIIENHGYRAEVLPDKTG